MLLSRIHKSTNQQLYTLVKSRKSLILESKDRLQHNGLNVNTTKFDATNKQNTTNGYESVSSATFNVSIKNQTF